MEDVAVDVLSHYKKPMAFNTLWQKVYGQLGMNDDLAKRKISNFYTKLSMDGRFVQKDNNRWQLKSRVKFEDAFVDTSAIEIDESDGEEEDDADEAPLEDEDYEDGDNGKDSY